MKVNTHKALKWLALSEGGYVDHPDDPGGPTNKGVTQRVYTAWLKNHGKPNKNVRFISKEEADAIFVGQYFDPVWFNKLPHGLDYAMADYSVNSGASRAIKDLQRTLNDLDQNVAVDGVMGNMTLAAVNDTDTVQLLHKLVERRMAFLKRLRHWKTFGKGWSRRVVGDEPGQQDYDNGVLDRSVRMYRGQNIGSFPKVAQGFGGKA